MAGLKKYRPKTQFMRHQKVALKKFLRYGSGALFAEMGTGKTKIAIDFACALATLKNKPIKAVVLCPKSVEGVWPDEIEKHDPYYAFGPKSGVEWTIVSIDSAWRPYWYDEISLMSPDVLIIDESDTIKSPTSRRSKGAYLLSRSVPHRLVMSGTPIGSNALDLFAQYKVADSGIFGTDFGAFKNEYALIRAHKVVKLLRQKKFKRKMKPITFSITKDQCLDLPERRGHAWDPDGPAIVRIPLEAKGRRIYDAMAEESIAEAEGHEVFGSIALTRLLRCAQISSGWLAGDGKLTRVGTEKQDQLKLDLEDCMRDGVTKVVVFCRFVPEMRDAAHAAKQMGFRTLLLHGGASKNNRTARIKAFHATKQPTVFIAQWQAGSRGIDLTCSSYCIAYGITESLIQYGQGIDRLHRKNQVNKVTYRHYVAENTINEGALQALVMKKSVSKALIEDPRILYGSGRGLKKS